METTALLTQLAIGTGTLAATALAMLIGHALAEYQHHRETTR